MASIFNRKRAINDQEICEPTVLAFVLAVCGFLLLAGVCIVLIIFLPVFGYVPLAFATICIVLVWLMAGLARKPAAAPATGRQLWFRRMLRFVRSWFIGIFVCWLGLIAWLVLGPGGPDAPPKPGGHLVRFVTWNIHCGQDEGLPWKQFDWPARKIALQAALEQVQPDILCVQEATPEQVAFLEKTLATHQRVGDGRDGNSLGEHCAIYFNRQRFEQLAEQTFWLEEPIDQPRSGSAFDVKRICTWVRLRDRDTGHVMRVYNTHMYLTEAPNLTAAKIILEQIAAGDPIDALVLTADFNATPSAPSRQLFLDAKLGLADSAERAGQPVGTPTFQLYGIGVSRIDGILVGPRWRVHDQRILDVKPHDTYPSDHFAIMVDLALP